MINKFLFATMLILTASTSNATDIVSRAESTELRLSNGKLIPRVERDASGNVFSLKLNEMELSLNEMEELGQMEHLRRLSP